MRGGRNGVGEQAVIVSFQYGLTDLKPLFALEDKLESAINNAGAGVLDGDEVASDGRDGCIYMYGENADRLFEVIKPVLASAAIMRASSSEYLGSANQVSVNASNHPQLRRTASAPGRTRILVEGDRLSLPDRLGAGCLWLCRADLRGRHVLVYRSVG